MKFGEYITGFERCQWPGTPEEWHKHKCSEVGNGPAETMIFDSQWIWLEYQRPYYKFAPDVLGASLNASLDVPCDLIRFPHPVFAVRLPTGGPSLLTAYRGDGDLRPIDAILVADLSAENFGGGGFSPGTRGLHVSIETHGTRLEPNDYQKWSLYLKLRNGRALEDEIAEVEWAGETRVVKDIFRAVLSACLFATCAIRFLLRDVLNRDQEKYDAMNPDNPRRKAIEDRADRYGRKGWTITTRHLARELQIEKAVDGSHDLSTSAGRELQYRHMRGAHWHTFPTAKNPQDRVQFLVPTLVRPDLPARGAE
jgi:hypothetical protein